MTYFSSSQFASAAASGNDWREVAKTVLEDLSEAKTSEDSFNLGFLYISDMLADDAESILNLFKSVLNIDHWVGGIGIGICANGQSFIDKPAISAMVGKFDSEDYCLFPPINQEPEKAANTLNAWLDNNDPMLVLATGDPMTDEDPSHILRTLEAQCSGFMIGGLTSSRTHHAQFAGELYSGGLCGAVFSSAIPVASILSQGCIPIGTSHTVTKCDGHEIHTLDERDALEVFEEDLRSMVIKKIDRDPDTIPIDEDALDDPSAIPEEFHSLVKGEVHAAVPVSESDQNDFLVRNIIGVNNDNNAVTISQHVSNGDRIMFVYRDHDSVYEDLSTQLLSLRERVQKDTGTFEPKGALYISCAARAFNEFEDGQKNEMQLIHEIIGDVPLTGFYAGGEINKARLYGYTGILTLFL